MRNMHMLKGRQAVYVRGRTYFIFTNYLVKSFVFRNTILWSPLKVNRLLLWLWRWRRHVPPKRRLTFNGLHGIIAEYRTVYNHGCENLKFYTVFLCVEATERFVTRFEKQIGSACYLLHTGSLLGLFFYLEVVGDISLRNTLGLSAEYTALYLRQFV
jgi:hypothetical protein